LRKQREAKRSLAAFGRRFGPEVDQRPNGTGPERVVDAAGVGFLRKLAQKAY
jgi:hypothetical protein